MKRRARRDDAGRGEQAFEVEGELGRRVGQLLVSMEAYPELKSDRPLVEAQQTWTETEAQITAARRFYNAAVNQLNNAIQIFPGPIIASIAGVQAMPFFEAPAAARGRRASTAFSDAVRDSGRPSTPPFWSGGDARASAPPSRCRGGGLFSPRDGDRGSETSDTIAGAFLRSGIVGAVAAPGSCVPGRAS